MELRPTDPVDVEVTRPKSDRLRAEIRGRVGTESAPVMVHWVLVRDGLPHQRASTRDTAPEWQLVESGLYLVQATIEVAGRPARLIRSRATSFFDPTAEAEFEEFLGWEPEESSPLRRPLRYAKLAAPFRELLVVGSKAGSEFDDERVLEATQSLQKATDLPLMVSKIASLGNLRVSVLSAEPPVDKLASGRGHELSAWQSGVIHRHQALIRSPEDLSEFARRGGRVRDLQHATGSYTLVLASQDEVCVSADYFGFNRWYVFEGQDYIVAANGYHLILEFLIGARQRLSLDRTALLSQLWSMRCQATMQNFSRGMGVVGVRQMTLAERLVLDRDGWRFDGTPLGSVLADRTEATKTEFSALLTLGAAEITAHVQAAVSDARNEHVLIDLSGGLDSRVIFAALENLRPTVDVSVCSINSRDTPGSRDLEIALSLVGEQSVRWNDSPVVRQWLSPDLSDQVSRSHYLGTYYSHNMWMSRLLDDRTVACNGACGEILARPYLSRNLFGTSCDESIDVPSFMTQLWHQWAHLSDTSCPEVQFAWHETFAAELVAQGCEVPYEALDRMYMTFRHAYHFDPSHAHSYIHLNIMPMQSPALFLLHHKMYGRMRGLEVQGALLNELNPSLASHEYESERDNRDMRRVLQRDLEPASVATVAKQRAAWSAAETVKRSSVRFANGRPATWAGLPDKQFEAARFALHRLIQTAELDLSPTLKLDMFRALSLMKGNPGKVRFAYNRFMSIVDQVDLVRRSLAGSPSTSATGATAGVGASVA